MEDNYILTCLTVDEDKVISKYESNSRQTNIESSFGTESFADILLRILAEKIKE